MFDQKKEKQDTKPPQVEDILVNIFLKAKYKPPMFPSDPKAAAAYWVNHQEPPNEFSEATRQETKGDKVYWLTPYHDRLACNLKVFLSMKKHHQMFIIDSIEKGIPWRGDGFEMFKMIVDETIIMKENPRVYIDGALEKLKNFKMRTNQ